MNVGVVLPLGNNEETGQPLTYREIRALARQIEQDGLDAVWVFDHLIYRTGEHEAGTWEGWTILTAIADATERVELGTLVLCTAFRNPAVLAKMAATLDEISGGRLILGLGAGWHEAEFAAFGIPFDHRVGRFQDALRIIAPLLRTGRVDYAGPYYEALNCALLPPDPRPGGPPILVASESPRMLRLTAVHADLWNTAWLGDPAPLAERVAALDAACAEVGRDPATLGVTVGVSVAFTDLAAVPALAEHPDRYLTGSPAQLAAGLRPYAARGVVHVICRCYPSTAEAFGRVAAAARLVGNGG